MTAEDEFLALRARQARWRLNRTASEMVDGVLAPLEVRPFVRRHPWSSLGAGALGGLLTGLGLRRMYSRRAETKKNQPKGGIARTIAAAAHRVRRLVSGAVGAMVLANLRDAGRRPPSHNGHASPGT